MWVTPSTEFVGVERVRRRRERMGRRPCRDQAPGL